MAYADALSARERGKGIAGVVAIHAGVAGLLAVGLTVTGVVTPKKDDPLGATTIYSPPPPPPEPPEPVERKVERPRTVDTQILAPPRPIDPPDNQSLTGTIPDPGPITFPDIGPIGLGGGEGTGPVVEPSPSPTPMFDPVAASPRDNPGAWITDSDYRSTWIRREMTGTASFALGINTKGRVTDCRITRSTGYTALDAATCKLISRRARFEPARNSDGQVTSGTYSNSIRWVLPE